MDYQTFAIETLAQVRVMLRAVPAADRSAHWQMADRHAKLARLWVKRERWNLAANGATTAKFHADRAVAI